MAMRRPLWLLTALALTLGILVWFAARDSELAPEVDLVAAPSAVDGSSRAIVAPIEDSGPQAAAKIESTREATEVPEEEEDDDEYESADGSVIRRAARAPRLLASAQGRVVDDHDSPLAGARVLASLRETRAGALLDAPANQGHV
ncbi:MAG: hypothetical protein ABIP42_05250, partial [Planctomycetota bacterium]